LWGDGGGTYAPIDYARLPPLDASAYDGSLAWLRALPECAPEDEALTLGQDDEAYDDPSVVPTRLAGLEQEARAAGLAIPKAVRAFFSQPDLLLRIPSCTACYVDVPSRLVTLPNLPGALLRVLNDQQCVFLWYVHLAPSGAHSAVCAEAEFLDDPKGDTLEDAATPTNLIQCADSFEEFLQRFQLENALWYAWNKQRRLSPAQQAYAAAVRSRA
jgi:hypothetical protein